jgi:predicted dithiol-disulfide oxidoreductase (DUF899 family)
MAKASAQALNQHPVVSEKEWIEARKALLAKEKQFAHLREELAQQRRDLPWQKVDKQYAFDGPNGKETLADLFGSKNQLIVYQFMFAPEWEEGCPHCSFWADHYDAMIPHLKQRDTSLVVVSRAPLNKIEKFKSRMGWRFKWVSSGQSDYNYDFQASFRPEDIQRNAVFYNYQTVKMKMTDREGISIFYKNPSGIVFHTYSTYARGIDMVNPTYQFLDLLPKGRDEEAEFPQSWVTYHDRYKE